MADPERIRKESPLAAVLDRLENVSSTESGHKALCPAHDDHQPSLSIREADDGKVLLKCHAGCDVEEIVSALGLEVPDLFADDQDRSWKPWEGTEEAAYTYEASNGEPAFQVVRYEMQDSSHPAYGEKKFLQRAYKPDHPDAGKKGCPEGYVWGRQRVPLLFYRLPDVESAIKRDEPVYLVEGEKDVHTLARNGFTATCIPGGANPDNWTPSLTRSLEGADVVCLPDNDAPGRKFMEAVANRLVKTAEEVRIVHLPGLAPKGDVTDFIEGGGSRYDIEDLARDADSFVPTPQTAEELADICEREEDESLVFEHIDLLAKVSADRYPPLRKRIKDATQVNLNDLQQARRAAKSRLAAEREERRRKKRRNQLEDGENSLVVTEGRPSSDIVDELCAALQHANDPPRLFRRKGRLVHLSIDEEDRARIEPVPDALFDDIVCRWTTCVDEDYEPRDPSKRLVERVAQRVDLPSLRGITRVPILRPDGSIRTDPGYDEATRLYYRAPPNTSTFDVPDDPSEGQIDSALDFLGEAWADHPFADQASRANTLALALTPVVRPLLGDANAPLSIIDATRAGSGKSLLAEIAGTMATGQTPATMTAPNGDAEWRKQITAQLNTGERFIVVDDVTGTIDSASLRRVITSSAWSDRILGESEQVRLPATTMWCATGNNLRPRGDMVRRCFLIRLDTQMVRPWKRSGFTHDQPDWTRENRGRLACALLTLARAWISAGQPAGDTPTLGSFERWSHVVGGILAHAGVDGFLENLSELEDSEFGEDQEWATLLAAVSEWQAKVHDENAFPVRTLIRFVKSHSEGSGQSANSDLALRIRDSLPEEIQKRLSRDEPVAKSLGRSFGYREDRRFPAGWHITRVGKGREGSRWRVQQDASSDQRRDRDTVDSTDAPEDHTHPEERRGGGGESDTSEGTDLNSHSHEGAPF